VRSRLGESRNAFAQRLRVSPSIVFLWESGRRAPRRASIVSRLQRLIAAAPSSVSKAKSAKEPPSSARRTGTPGKRKLNLSPKRRAPLKIQGPYMGHLRRLNAKQKAQVKTLKTAKGFPAAITLARKLGGK
jgi:hypothetical protein